MRLNYTSQVSLAVYQRFVARRGMPAHIYNDNGTIFQGADQELRDNLTQLRQNPDLPNFCINCGNYLAFYRSWSSWLWRSVGSGCQESQKSKYKCVGCHILTIQQFATTLSRIEACFNSRPVGPFSDDPDDTRSVQCSRICARKLIKPMANSTACSWNILSMVECGILEFFTTTLHREATAQKCYSGWYSYDVIMI